MPSLGMGTWGMGGKYEKDESNVEDSISALRFGLDLGLKLIDTAELYGAGLTEEIIGRAIKGYNREDIFLVSKVWKTNLQKHNIQKAIKNSLNRLGVDYLDLYLVHWPSDSVPLSEIIPAMESLVNEGLTKNIGVSNFSVSQLKEAQDYLKKTILVVNQIEYSLFAQDTGREIVPFCLSNGIRVMAYRPLYRGVLISSVDLEMQDKINKLSIKYKKTPTQIALNWLIAQDIIPIPKSSNQAHLQENIGAIGWKMSVEDINLLKK